jgi:hypothetical protein
MHSNTFFSDESVVGKSNGRWTVDNETQGGRMKVEGERRVPIREYPRNPRLIFFCGQAGGRNCSILFNPVQNTAVFRVKMSPSTRLRTGCSKSWWREA